MVAFYWLTYHMHRCDEVSVELLYEERFHCGGMETNMIWSNTTDARYAARRIQVKSSRTAVLEWSASHGTVVLHLRQSTDKRPWCNSFRCIRCALFMSVSYAFAAARCARHCAQVTKNDNCIVDCVHKLSNEAFTPHSTSFSLHVLQSSSPSSVQPHRDASVWLSSVFAHFIIKKCRSQA